MLKNRKGKIMYFLTFKIKNLFIALMVIIVTLMFVFGVYQAVSVASPRPQITVVIDAGHGGIDGGVTGIKTGVKESDLNLKIAFILAKQFKNANVNVILTRKTKYALYDMNANNLKKQDFERRKKIIEDANPTVVVSIHMNYYKSSSRRGSQVFFDGTNSQSRILGNTVQYTLNNNINYPYIHRNFSALPGDYFIINCTTNPSIIVECGFLSNPEDEKLLTTESYREYLSYQIFSGIMAYIATA